jgi:hypothetical protein
MRYLDFLDRLHAALEPPTYFEVGVRRGDSLRLARASAIGVDPAYELPGEVPSEWSLFRETSDEYFDRPDPLAPFGGRAISLAFIDGMHLLEFALRDFVNVERNAEWTSVAVFDDVFPRDTVEAARKRRSYAWTGDVYCITTVLAHFRPDLVLLPVATETTGLLLVLGLDPQSTALDSRFEEIVLATVGPDPQPVPAHVLERRGALDPETVLSSPVWSLLRRARGDSIPARRGRRELRRALRKSLAASRAGHSRT